MIESLIMGKLFKDIELKKSSKQTLYCNFMLSVLVGDQKPILVSGIAFNDQAEKIARFKKGDSLSVVGSLKPNQWPDKTTGEIKHGLTLTVQDLLSVYDLKKRRNDI